MNKKTISQKIWESHSVKALGKDEVLLYIDLHLLHEINTPQAFESISNKKIAVRRPDKTLATEDHNTPTTSILDIDKDTSTWTQIRLLRENCSKYGIEQNKLGDHNQGITHVIAPEQGRVLPGSTVVCCDSHTTTHGAFGALAFGIGTSQVEHVLATQTLRAIPFRSMCIEVSKQLPEGTSAKDLALTIINQIGTGGGQGYIIEYRGDAIKSLSMEQRMTLCNMSVEAGASAGIISPDEKTIEYLKKAFALKGKHIEQKTIDTWLSYATDSGAVFDKYIEIDASTVKNRITWGTNPSQSVPVGEHIPFIKDIKNTSENIAAIQALKYMKLNEGQNISTLKITNVFVGSCTNGRIEDLRIVAEILKNNKVHHDVHMLIVPGSMSVLRQALDEELDKIFESAGADFRSLSGCSLCVGLNTDKLDANKRTVSTSNRNFEGRQGTGVRTHITSPAIAAATAIRGFISTPADIGK
ncbi:isopropylmalate isomerase large subunit [Xenorhabdus stockiae]|uniref:3-isopropylmalate dehydratase n=1 Tax=Xenorhabdus stockiae TaxID=351614 RepID=A0A2D0KNR7_9GAMM|nr:3-isopropylmalate dehydratase large subunit [Xenorhabdus stockiae]PHM64867.1 isopropylmalate isomerase large subunit [Xenorhabdus stockiae]